MREPVAKALINKGVELGLLGRREEAIAACDDLLARFGTATELPMREEVAKALFNKGVELGLLRRSEEAIAAYDDLLARFGTATELPMREPISCALINKGAELGLLDRFEESIAAWHEALIVEPDTEKRRALVSIIQQTGELISLIYQEALNKELAEAESDDSTEFDLDEEQYYNEEIMDKEESLESFTARKRVTVAQLEEIVDNWNASNSELTKRDNRDRARPKWDTDREQDEDPARFAARAYAHEVAAGTLHRGIIHREDPSLYRALYNWLARGNKLPDDFDLPTKSEWNDRQVAKGISLPARSEDLKGYERVLKQKVAAAQRGISPK
jgi:tetratricopeptide (TPR) repeat protein